MLKIVVKHLKGRRGIRDLLTLVIFLSFLFMLSALIFFYNQGVNAQKGREETFGIWENALYLNDADTVENLLNLPEITSSGQSRIVGHTTYYGLLGTINEDLEKMGNFRLKKGRMPTGLDEIVIEEKQLLTLGKDFQLGEETVVAIEIKEEENAALAEEEKGRRIIYDDIKAKLEAYFKEHPQAQQEVLEGFSRHYVREITMTSLQQGGLTTLCVFFNEEIPVL